MIDVTPNTTMFGKRNKLKPFKAVLNGHDLPEVYGTSKSEAKENALQHLEEAYIAAQGPLVVRVANDGTVFVARWTGKEQMEYLIQHPDRSGSSCLGVCRQSLQSYMDVVVRQYNEVTVAA